MLRLHNAGVLSGLYFNALLYVIALMKCAIFAHLYYYTNNLLTSEEFWLINYLFDWSVYILKKLFKKHHF